MRSVSFSTAGVLAAALLASACTTAPKPPTTMAEVGELRAGSGYVNGYLTRADMADSLALVPPPPAEKSARLADDVEAYRALTALRNGPRGAQAAKDAVLKFPAAADHFACALGVQISEQNTPHLNMLLRRTLADAGGATYKAKDKYQRARPFMVFNEPTCTPGEEAHLRKDGSYPSGHSALGWAWALVLTQVAPERTDAPAASSARPPWPGCNPTPSSRRNWPRPRRKSPRPAPPAGCRRAPPAPPRPPPWASRPSSRPDIAFSPARWRPRCPSAPAPRHPARGHPPSARHPACVPFSRTAPGS